VAGPAGAGHRPRCDGQPGVTAIQRRDRDSTAAAHGLWASSGARGFDKLMISSVAAGVSGGAGAPSRGPFTETFFLPPFQRKQILDSNPPGGVAARVHRPTERG
jgi:hypothetical protein